MGAAMENGDCVTAIAESVDEKRSAGTRSADYQSTFHQLYLTRNSNPRCGVASTTIVEAENERKAEGRSNRIYLSGAVGDII